MAETRFEALLQVTLGLPWRQATEEQRKKANEINAAVSKKWKTAGIELVGYFGTPSAATGASHNYIFRVKDAAQFRQMAVDLSEAKESFKYIEKSELTLGWEWDGLWEWWNKL